MLRGTNSEVARGHNQRIVLETIRLHGPVSRADTARLTGLTRAAISNIVHDLVQRGLVLENGRRRGRRGMPWIALELDPAGTYALGLDMDRDHLSAVLVDFVGSVRQRVHHELDFPTPEGGIDLIADAAEELLASAAVPRERIAGVGVGFPGPLIAHADDHACRAVAPLQFPGWHGVPVARLLSERLGLPVLLENNASAAAVGEHWYGDHGFDHFYYVYFGAGLGGGMIANGQPYDGYRGNAGELGYLAVRGHPGITHLGEFFHLPWLYARLRHAGVAVAAPCDLEPLHREGHPILRSWLDEATPHLAAALVAIEHLFDPEAIVLGGRLPAPLLDVLLEALERLLPALRNRGKPYPAALVRARAGDDAAALGLATLPIMRAFAPTPSHPRMARPLATGAFPAPPLMRR